MQIVTQASHLQTGKESFWKRSLEFLHQLLEELLAPPTLAAVSFFSLTMS